MDNQDRQAIEGLFDRVRKVEADAPPVDGEAMAFIREQVARQPGAPYFMAQTIVMQDYALQDAQRRIEELEAQGSRSGGFFSSLFGGGAPARPNRAYRQEPTMGGPGRYASPDQRRQGGGFLAGAAQTAMGVAGGVLLGSALGSMFAGDAQADDGSSGLEGESAGSFEDDFGGDEF